MFLKSVFILPDLCLNNILVPLKKDFKYYKG